MMPTRTKHEVVRSLAEDLEQEQINLHAILTSLDEAQWSRPTPAEGWTIHDQITHLAHFDFLARLSVAEPDRFAQVKSSIDDLSKYVDSIGPANLSRSGADAASWWTREASNFINAVIEADPQVRVPWFGPDMSLASKVTARIMEVWAHGQDIRDSLSIKPHPSPAHPHVARLGCLAFANSYAVRGLPVPQAQVRVELETPNGGLWDMGPQEATDRITGPIDDFCLIVTQRRHVDDTAIQTQGETAAEWMLIAQAFAGDPGSGRHPGQFTAHV
jgi:uncharacterized protein (TIGR03084 family)